MSLSAGTRLGPYEIHSLIGAGGMGEVYKARDTRLGRTVAIKVLPAGAADDPDKRRRFVHEARAASALNRWTAVSLRAPIHRARSAAAADARHPQLVRGVEGEGASEALGQNHDGSVRARDELKTRVPASK
jgi:serine/threonine protein kinase